MQQYLKKAESDGAISWFLSCDSEVNGVWAGLKDWLYELIPQIQESAPELIAKHSYELTLVLPDLRRKISVRNPNLTDTAVNDESVRNYPLDRAYRILHGLIDLLDAWYQYTDGSPWVIACDCYNRTGALVRRFFAELMRRRGQQLNLTLLIATDPGAGEAVAGQFVAKVVGPGMRLNFPHEPLTPVSKEEMARLAQELEQQVRQDTLEVEIHLPRLIRYWLLSDQPEKALIWQVQALGIYNHQGFYEDALVYGEVVSSQLERLCGENSTTRWNIVGNLFACYIAVGDVARALWVVEEEALAKIDNPRQLVRVYYVMAMLYARFLPNHDLIKAAEYLERGLEDLTQIDLPTHEKHFFAAFTMNGLAFVRHRQGRSAEAVELCRTANERLNTYLRPGQHRLHRSILLYNIAQVYASTGLSKEAITHFTAAMVMDPNYSEYYNERGNVYLKIGYLDEALNDYLKAIELSPPYPEVWSNLGQCYRLMGQITEAVNAYSTSLDLNPDQFSVLVARAQAFEMLEQQEAALVDYNAALTLNPEQPLLLANRA
ncbi:MAG: tetratricopeptide repeat protein, partial [Rubrobacter sp.]|nr:tetratricopeptide repeat protein [Rubrobacter sp.]